MERLLHQDNGKIKCGYCGKEYSKNGIETHIWRKHEDGINFNPNKNRKDLFKNGKIKIWNKGLSIDTDERVKKLVQTQIENIKSNKNKPGWLGKKHSSKTKLKISKALSINNKGGRCKWYEAKRLDGTIFKVQGTWEYKFVDVLNIIDPDWIKIGTGNKFHSFKWKNNDKEHWYTPDFYSPKFQKYFEIKGYWWGKDKEKMDMVMSQNKLNIEIVDRKKLNYYLKEIGNLV